jgi:hypothetical protein
MKIKIFSIENSLLRDEVSAALFEHIIEIIILVIHPAVIISIVGKCKEQLRSDTILMK